MSYEDWRLGTNAKTHSSWNLHTLLPKNMHFFVLRSSISGITGQGGQANYAAGNTYKDALAHHRIAQGQKAVSIDLGVMVSEGFLSENSTLLHRMMDSGLYVPLTHTELFALLDHYCDPALVILTPQNCQPVIGIEPPARLHAKGIDEAPWMLTPLFSHTHQVRGAAAPLLAPSTPSSHLDFRTLFATADSVPEAASIAMRALIRKLSQTLSTASEGIDPDRPVHAYGVDSLLAIELRTWVAREFAAEMAVFEILGGATAGGMAGAIAWLVDAQRGNC